MIRKPNSVIVLFFVQNNSYFENKLKQSMLALTSLDVTFIVDSACLSASFGDKGCSVLQIFSK